MMNREKPDYMTREGAKRLCRIIQNKNPRLEPFVEKDGDGNFVVRSAQALCAA